MFVRRLTFVSLVVFTAVGASCSTSPASQPSAAPRPSPDAAPVWRVVDLGHALAETDPSWSGTPVFSYRTVATPAKDGYFAGAFSTEEHFGTHVDAPAHFSATGLTVDRLPADRLVRPGICVSVATHVAGHDDYQVTVEDLQAFEREHGAIPEGAFVFIATGWDARWPDPARYMNVRAGVKHFPGISAAAAKYLAGDRKVAGIGIDTASIDYGPSENFEAHRTTMPLGVYHVENATGLDVLPATGFTVVVAPIKIKGGSGGPARVFALLE
jgi:kynurenine formamidase